MEKSRGTSRSRDTTQVMRSTHRKPAAAVVIDILRILTGALIVLLGFRFALKLFGANPEAGFVQFVYELSGVFMAPFRAVFSNDQVSGNVFEWSALVAMAVYALVVWGIISLINAVPGRTSVSEFEQTEAVEGSEQDASSTIPSRHDEQSPAPVRTPPPPTPPE